MTASFSLSSILINHSTYDLYILGAETPFTLRPMEPVTAILTIEMPRVDFER